MEPTQPSLREQPAQLIVPNISQPQIQTEPVISQAAPGQEQKYGSEPAKPLYNPKEVEQIVGHLTSGIFDPEYILLFGKLVGGTRFSDPMAYDLLMVVRETPSYDWIQAKRYLRYQMPLRHREITYINIYILPLNYVEGNNSPFLYFTHNEGKLIYCKDRHYFHPKKLCNFAVAYCDAKFHFDTFSELGMLYLEKAYSEYVEGRKLRPAALFTVQAAVYFYHTLYYVFHGYEFEIHDPVFTKVELAKYINAWQEVHNGKSLVVGPHIVVRGNEKNYARFISYNLPDIKHIDVAWFEDAIAKAILFKTADKRYGTKITGTHIGELKQVVVPYTLSLLNIITGGKLDLFHIWKNQSISPALSDFIYDLMKQVNGFILAESPVSHYIEWAKKEECWLKVRGNAWAYDINDILQDCIDEDNPPRRNHKSDIEDEEADRRHREGIIRSIPFSLWKKIETWGRDTGMLQPTLTSLASDIAYKLKNKRKFADSDISRGYKIYETVWQHNPELLEEADALAEQDMVNATETVSESPTNDITDMTLELIQQMVDWNKCRHVLEDWKWNVMKDVLDGRKTLTDRMKYAFYLNLEKLRKAGFPN